MSVPATLCVFFALGGAAMALNGDGIGAVGCAFAALVLWALDDSSMERR